MNTVITAVPENKCTGCGGCVNACPTNALSMGEDTSGFVVPIIEESKCINCGKCLKVCPVNMNQSPSATNNKKVYAMRASDEIRKKSSSGGIFTLAAQTILSQGGIVCGAAFDSKLSLKHILVDSEERLDALRGSKYVQSDIGYVYRDIKKILESGKPVLFTGCPCQAAALKSYLSKDYSNLYIVDILCHGVPSQRTLHKYLQDQFPGKVPTNVMFRNKAHGWLATHIDVVFEDGDSYHADWKQDAYEKVFQHNLLLRSSCMDCQFAEDHSASDMTIGDFWGIQGIDPSQNDKKGTSMVLIHTEKGHELLNLFKKELIGFKEYDFEAIRPKIKNRIYRKFSAHKNRERFKELINHQDFGKAVDLAMNSRYDIGIVGIHTVGNFGGALTYYALYKTICDLGYSALMIERPRNAPHKPKLSVIYEQNPYPAYAEAPIYPTKESMRVLNDSCETFVVGSDQLFNDFLYNNFGKWATLDWVEDNHKKIAYAASFGHDTIWSPEETRAEMSFFMKKFDAFSVREESGVRICKEDFGVAAEWVLDPVFLCNVQHYDELAESTSHKKEMGFIGGYILDPDNSKKDILDYVCDKLQLPYHLNSEMIYHPPVNSTWDYPMEKALIEERLWNIKNSDFFVADSFHGICFAILFHKNFIAILNSNRGGSRFRTILSKLGLMDRLVTTVKDIEERNLLFTPIDYDEVDKKLAKEKERCLNWLKNQIASPVKKSISDYDMMYRLVSNQRARIDALTAQNSLLLQQMKSLFARMGMAFSAQDSLSDYLNYVNSIKQQYTICVSIKDTPGFSYRPEYNALMERLGFKIDLVDKHWHPYIAVMDGGEVIYEKIGETSEKLQYSHDFSEYRLEIVSAGLKGGNISQIKINNKNFSKNMRGVNIVVIDKFSNNVVDSVNFDTHSPDVPCFRY